MPTQRRDLPPLNAEEVRKWATLFDANPNFAMLEKALAWLFKTLPTNTDRSSVLLKVVALNRLYSTQIYSVFDLTHHIVDRAVDDLLEDGSHVAVELIAACQLGGRVLRLDSFASKYCSWHRASSYPMLDVNVKLVIWEYQQRDRFAAFRKSDLDRYAYFVRAHEAVIDAYALEEVDLKTLDKGLWMLGDHLKRDKSE